MLPDSSVSSLFCDTVPSNDMAGWRILLLSECQGLLISTPEYEVYLHNIYECAHVFAYACFGALYSLPCIVLLVVIQIEGKCVVLSYAYLAYITADLLSKLNYEVTDSMINLSSAHLSLLPFFAQHVNI